MCGINVVGGGGARGWEGVLLFPLHDREDIESKNQGVKGNGREEKEDDRRCCRQ